MELEATRIPNSWALTSLESVCEILDSRRIPLNNSERSQRIIGRSADDLYPYYGATGQVGVIDDFIFEGEHILLGEDGAPFLDPFKVKSYLVDGKFWVNNHAHILKSAVPNKFLCHYLNQIDYSDYVTGTTRMKLTQNALKRIPVLVAPIAEQRRIVAKIEVLFSELDKGVESLKTAQAKLNVYRQAVLKHAFEGKLTAQWREENKDKLETPEQLLARIKQERAARYNRQLREWETAVKEWEKNEKKGKKPERPRESNPVQSIEEVLCKKLPTITDHWIWVRLKQVGRIETGTTPSTKYPGNYGGKLPFFKPTDLDQGAHVQTAREYLSEIGAESARVLPADSILVTCIGATIGKTGFTRLSCATNQQINSVSPDAGFDSKFVYLQALAPFFNSKVKSEASATTLPILNKSKFEELPFILCTLTEQQEIVRLLERRFVAVEQQVRGIDSELEQAEILRQSILKKAFSGKLVAQDLNDEPASILLDRIRVEREKAVKNNHAKKSKKRKTAV